MKAALHDMLPTPRNSLINLLVLIMVIACWGSTDPMAAKELTSQAKGSLTSELGGGENCWLQHTPTQILVCARA